MMILLTRVIMPLLEFGYYRSLSRQNRHANNLLYAYKNVKYANYVIKYA